MIGLEYLLFGYFFIQANEDLPEEQVKDLEQEFLQYAQQCGMVGIKGHRDVGGFRASCYNAMPLEGVQALVKVMQDFEAAKVK